MPAPIQATPRRAPPLRPPAPPTASRQNQDARSGPRDARFSTLLASRPAGQGAGDKRMYRMSDGTMVELPADMRLEDAARLETEAKAAQKQLGKGPPPKPVPEVRQDADKAPGKKGKPKAGAQEKKGAAGQRKAAVRTAAGAARLKPAGGGKAAQYLLAKAAPVLDKRTEKLRKLSRNEQSHDDAAQKLRQSENAVVIPASEGQSKSNAGQVNAVDGRAAPAPDEKKGKHELQESLAANVPQSIEDVDNFKRDKKAQHIGADVMKVVQGDKNAVVETFADMERTPPPAPAEQTPEPLPPAETAPATAGMNLGQDAVAPLQKEHTDVSSYTKEADGKLKEEGLTQEQLDMVDNGDLAHANKEKKGMETTARQEPMAVQKFAQQETGKIDRDLKQEEKKERGALQAKRRSGLGATGQKQKHAKSSLERKRDEVAGKINGIYKTAQDKVRKKLADLETQSMKRFDDGNAKASKAFEDNVKRDIDAFKDDRYSGFFGWARKAKDWLLGMDELPQVKAIFERNRATFVATLDKLVADISADNKRVVQECKDELTRAKAQIKDYVDKLGPDLKDIGKKTAGEVSAKLNELDGFIRKKEEELQQKLADKQQAAIKAIDEKIEKMKEAMSGALAKLGKLLLWAAKKFFTWALGKFGYSLGEIEGIISKGAAVLKAIFTKPIVFVKNLIQAAKTGFQNFGKNFLTHLKDAIFDWLTGSLSGIRLPATWDLKGIASVALQILGLTWTNIRGKLVKAMGETAVKSMEAGFDLVVTLVRDGPMAAWEKLKEMADDIKQAFIEGVQDFIKIKIVQKAIETVVALFVPGAGIIRAVVGIYDTIVFFIQKAKQIAQMVGNFLASVGEIAMGNIGAAASALEKGLATALKLVINFLAKLLRLDGIAAKIRAAIQKLQAKVDGMLDKVVNWIADKAKKLFGKVKAGAKALLQWWKKKRPFAGGGETHTLLFQGTKNNAELMVQSQPKKPEDFIKDYVPDQDTKPVRALVKDIDKLKTEVGKAQAKTPPDEVAIAKLDADLTVKFNALGTLLAGLLDKTADEGSEKNPVPIEYPKRRAAAYPNIYVGPPTNQYLKQSWLKDAAAAGGGKKAKDKLALAEPKLTAEPGFMGWGGAVTVLRANGGPGQALPAGGTCGLDPAFAGLAPGKVLTYDEKGRTGGGGKINNLFKPYGFRPGKEGMDGDHVMERQLGGPDAINNLWPLQSGENRSSGSTVNSMKVTVASKALTVHEARQKRKKKALHLLVKTVR